MIDMIGVTYSYMYLEHDQSGQLSGERAGVDVILGGQISKSTNINLEEERLECFMIYIS